MRSLSLKSLISEFQEAANEPEYWPVALQNLAERFGGVGAVSAAHHLTTKTVEWARFWGAVANRGSDYVDYYAARDPWLPLVSRAKRLNWIRLSETLPANLLSKDEWYQDFMCPSGVHDILAVRVHQSHSHGIFVAVQYGPRHKPYDLNEAKFQPLLASIEFAAKQLLASRMRQLTQSIGDWAIDNLADAVFILDSAGQVLEMNAAAERLLQRGRGLAIEYGRLQAIDAKDDTRLTSLVTNAHAPAAHLSPGRMIVRRGADYGLTLTIYPLRQGTNQDARPRVLVRVVTLGESGADGSQLIELFGFSPAEDRLARALMEGSTLLELTGKLGLQMSTLRTELRSILKKCGVRRQADLMRVLFSTS